ncbi:unnamed protein product [Soboliphyme baturini]|uniref:INT_SG_DDX_CT_C domain-containing protein n=1 Tax=Soboliphyme baturini TaxID=241478 RepID=A0A183J0F2_9BILA|nr:unnamed protein product [Soboliphyme baturini]
MSASSGKPPVPPSGGVSTPPNRNGGGTYVDLIDPFVKRSSIKRKQKKLQGSSHYKNDLDAELEPLPSFKDVQSEKVLELFIQKIQLCQHVFDFMDPVSQVKSKEVKRNTLTELIDFISTNKGVIVEQVYSEVVNMALERNCYTRAAKTNYFEPAQGV